MEKKKKEDEVKWKQPEVDFQTVQRVSLSDYPSDTYEALGQALGIIDEQEDMVPALMGL